MDAFAQHRTWQRAGRLVLSQLLCLGRHTVTNLLGTCGRQHCDWSADYRLYSQDSWNPRGLFQPVIHGVLGLCPDPSVFVVAMDDTPVRKTGRKVPGAGWGRDPLSPAFHCNLIWLQRFLQVSAILYTTAPPGPGRAVPIWFQLVPPVPKPKRSDPPEVWRAYRKQRRQENLCTHGAAILQQIRQELDQHHAAWERKLIACVDGSYFNQTVLKALPPRTTLIGRVRRDAELFFRPDPPGTPIGGPARKYGPRAPTPEALRQAEDQTWQEVTAFACGKLHTFRVKTLGAVLWRKAGADRPLRLLVIAPVGYRLRMHSKLLYRQPAYLLCTDVDLAVEWIVQYYLWRWDIETDHREEKQIIGVGQAQLTSRQSAERQPQLAVAGYSMLLLAAARAFGKDAERPMLPPPKWQANHPKPRLSTQDLVQQLRNEVWAFGLERLQEAFDLFVTAASGSTRGLEAGETLASAVLYVGTG